MPNPKSQTLLCEARRPGQSRVRNPQSHGFTLIELMVVILIITVLLALGIGAGMYLMGQADVKKTQAGMALLVNAIEKYHEAEGDYPDGYDPDSDGNDNGVTMTEDTPGYEAFQEAISELPSDMTERDTSGSTVNYTFIDAFGTNMRYEKTGGLGGKPRIISAGPDVHFFTTSNNYDQDDIYSDK